MCLTRSRVILSTTEGFSAVRIASLLVQRVMVDVGQVQYPQDRRPWLYDSIKIQHPLLSFTPIQGRFSDN